MSEAKPYPRGNPARFGKEREGQRAAPGVNKRLAILSQKLGMRFGPLKELSEDPGYAHLFDLLADMRPESAREVILAIPIARRADRLLEIQGLFASLKDVQAARSAEAIRLRANPGEDEPPAPGAESGLLLPCGKVDQPMLSGFATLLRLAAEEVGDLPAVPQSGSTTVNVFSAAEMGAVVQVLCGAVPGKEEHGA